MKMGFTTENKSSRGPDYPKLYLDYGQTARICLIDPEPEMLYVHVFNMPVVEDGNIVMKTVKGPKGDREEMVTEFVAQFRCHGDLATVSKEEIDPDRCEGCKKAEEHPSMFPPPRRKFAQHVLRYETQPGTFSVQTPFQAKLLVWVYAEGRFNTLVDFATEHGDLRKKDLMLGPCENKTFQKFDIKIGNHCEWVADEQRQKFVADLYQHNKCEDLEGMIARVNSALTIKGDATKVIQRWSTVRDGSDTSVATESALGADVLAAVSGLVDTPAAASEAPAEETPAAEAPAAEAPAAEAPAAEAPAEEKKEEEKVTVPASDEATDFDFDSLLDGI